MHGLMYIATAKVREPITERVRFRFIQNNYVFETGPHFNLMVKLSATKIASSPPPSLCLIVVLNIVVYII